MPKQEIEFIIKPDGTVEERVTGVSGPECEQITRAIEEALGDVARRDRTSDYFGQSHGTDQSVNTGA